MRQTALRIAGLMLALTGTIQSGPAHALEPPLAQGPCADGEGWTALPSFLSYGPCDSARAGAIQIFCEGEKWGIMLMRTVPNVTDPGFHQYAFLIDGNAHTLDGRAAEPGQAQGVGFLSANTPSVLAAVDAMARADTVTLPTTSGDLTLPLDGYPVVLAAARETCIKGTN